jgi:ketosteroid isomerase-like protein
MCVLAMLPAAMPTAAAQDPKHEMEAQYAKIDKAFKERDADYLVSLLTPDFTFTDKSGTTSNREQIAASLHNQLEATTDVEESATQLDAVEVKGDTVVATTTQHVKLHVTGSDGKSHLYDGTAKARDTWVHGADGWAIKHSDELEQKATLDGQPAQ